MKPFIALPTSFREMPRWWREGAAWLDRLPATAEAVCRAWNLTLDGAVMHGSNAIVVPVRRDGEPLALRLAPPDQRSRDEIRALRFWDGRGTVRLLDADPDAGATLLERLDGDRTLSALPLANAVPVIAGLIRRLAVPAPPDVPSTAGLARDRAGTMATDWSRLGEPFDRAILQAAIGAARELATTTSALAVDGDLHFGQVLAGTREPWLVVDPLLLRGDIEYDLARILWSRLDEMADNDEVLRWFEMIVAEAGLDPDRARSWALFRTVDYWLWGLAHGLTEDPIRCARLARIVGWSLKGPNMTDLDQRVIQPLQASHPELGRWLWAMEDTRRRTLESVAGVTQEELDWTPAGLANSIGTLLYHTALIETDYLCIDILGMDDYLSDLKALLPWSDRDEAGELIVVTGLPLEDHLDRLATVRSRFLEYVSALTAEQMEAPRALPDWGYAITPAWTLHHLMQHEAEHRGEINSLRALFRAQA